MTSEDGNIKQSLLENKKNSEIKSKSKNSGILYKIFGCCLDRASQSRNNTAGNQNEEEDEDEIGQYQGFNPPESLQGTNYQQSAPYYILSFNKSEFNFRKQYINRYSFLQIDEKDIHLINNSSDGSKGYIKYNQNGQLGQYGETNQYNNQGKSNHNGIQEQKQNGLRDKQNEGIQNKGNIRNKSSKRNKQQLNQAMNYEQSINCGSDSNFDLQSSSTSNEFRSSSLSTKTHNYDFDISNYNVNQVFTLGKLLQLMVIIKDQRHSIDYFNLLLPDDFNQQRLVNSLQIKNNGKTLSTNQNINGNHQSYDNNNHHNSLGQNGNQFQSYEFNPHTIKYYRRRQVYFGKYKEGIKVDNEYWSHMIPECIIEHISNKVQQFHKKESIIDTSCGVGQFSIGFAKYIKTVIAIETNQNRIDLAANNASIYQLPYSKCNSIDKLIFNQQGIQFYSSAAFVDESFSILHNQVDSIFLVPHLLSNNIDYSGLKEQSYFESAKFYDEVKLLLRKAFKISCQVVLLTPRNVKIVEIVDAFTDVIKDNVTELNSQAEYKFINQQLEKCYNINKPKSTPQNPKTNQLEKKKQIRIHQQVFIEIGKFQLLNIIENMKISEDQTLLSLFYAYLISHNFISQARISYIISRKQYTSSNLSTNTNHNMMVSEIKEEDDTQCRESTQQQDFRRVSSFTIKGNLLQEPQMIDYSQQRRTNTQNQYNTEDESSHTDNNGNNNYYNCEPSNITWDEESKQENKSSSKQTNFEIESSGSSRIQNSQNMFDFRKLDSQQQSVTSNPNEYQNARNTRAVYQKSSKNSSMISGQFQRNPKRSLTSQASQINQYGNGNNNLIINDLDDKEIISNNFNDNGNNVEDNDDEDDDDDQEKFYSETDTETESDFEYEDDSSFAKNNLNTSSNTNNQVSFLRKTQRVYESKLEEYSDRTRGPNDIKKSQLSSNSSQLQDQQDQLVVFHFNFFEQNKNDISFSGNNMNTSFNLLNTSRLIAQEINNEQRDVNQNLNNIIPTNLANNNNQFDRNRTISGQNNNADFAFTMQDSQI